MQSRAKSGIRKPKVILSNDIDIVGLEPTSFTLVFKDSKWREAMSKEFNTLLVDYTWELVPS